MEGKKTPTVRIDRKSSIETEPRTLPIDLVDYARTRYDCHSQEEARYVVNTRSSEDASRIFTAGLEKTERSHMRMEDIIMSTSDGKEHDGRMSPLWRDVASAPF